MTDPTTAPLHSVLAVVLQVRAGQLAALLWQRAREPFAGAWALPGGCLAPGETLEASIRRHLAAKVDVRELAHVEQLGSWSDPAPEPELGDRDRVPRPRAGRRRPASCPPTRPGTPSTSCRRSAFDHGEIVLAGRERLRGKLSYTNAGFALAPESFTLSELRGLYAAALGHDVSATNLKRVLLRRAVLESTGARREPGRAGGRPAELYRFRSRGLEITDPFAALRPPTR